MPGSADCELIRDGLLAQPANAWSSIAYVLAGAVVGLDGFRRGPGRRAWPITFAAALTLVGASSVYYHGPQGNGAEIIHDVPIIGLLFVASTRSAQEIGLISPRLAWASLAALTLGSAVAIAAWPAMTIPVIAIAATAAICGEAATLQRSGFRVRRRRLRADLVALALIGAAGIAKLLSGTGGPLCDPASSVQGHAVWHLLTAAGFAVYGTLALDREAG